MRKKIIYFWILVSVGVFLWSNYNSLPMSFGELKQFVVYIFYWTASMALSSILIFRLNSKKYKMWNILSLGMIALSLFIAYKTGGGNGSIISYDGEYVTRVLSILYLTATFIFCAITYGKDRRRMKN